MCVPDSSLVLGRAILLGLIFVLHGITLVVLSVGLATSESLFQGFPLALSWISLIVVAGFLLHKVARPQAQHRKFRGYFTFIFLFLTGFINFVAFLARLKGNELCQDFAGMKDPCTVGNGMVVASCFTTLFSIAGITMTYVEKVHIPIEKTIITTPIPIQYPRPPPHSHSQELGHRQSKYVRGKFPPWDPSARKLNTVISYSNNSPGFCRSNYQM
ncbi:hypothetical protein BDN72DRAFT_836116, partial [Pluteus cervinus]